MPQPNLAVSSNWVSSEGPPSVDLLEACFEVFARHRPSPKNRVAWVGTEWRSVSESERT